MRPPLLVTSPRKIVTWFDQDALVTRVLCFLRSIKRESSFFANSFLFIDDENSVTISETREYLVHVLSAYLFAIFQVNLAFSKHVCNFVIMLELMFLVNVVNSFQSMF